SVRPRPATPRIYTLSLHDALPILQGADGVAFIADSQRSETRANSTSFVNLRQNLSENGIEPASMPLVIQFNKRDLADVRSDDEIDRKSTRLNSSHVKISYAVFCLK